jgi:hypothetical protein
MPALPLSSEPLKPGTWVQYSLFNRSTRQGVLVRIAALEHEGGGQWFEVGITDGRSRTTLIKTLVLGSLAAPKKVVKAVIQPPGQQPLLLPDELAARPLPPFRAGRDPRSQLVAKERVKVPAGSFLAEKYRTTERGKPTDAWFSSQVAGWPMVKLLSPELSLELAAFGTGARSEVRGTPTKLDPRFFQPPGAPPPD